MLDEEGKFDVRGEAAVGEEQAEQLREQNIRQQHRRS